MRRNFLGLLVILALVLAAPGPAGAAGDAGLPAFFGNWAISVYTTISKLRGDGS